MGAQVFDDFEQAIITAHDGKQSSQPEDKEPPSPPPQADKETDVAKAIEEGEASATPEAGPVTHQGRLIVDATVAEQAIRFPTDLSLLNEARAFSERIIDKLCAELKVIKKPRTYRQKARSAYLAIAKQKQPQRKTIRRGIKQQLQYLRRNLGHIEGLLADVPEGQPLPLPGWLQYRYWVIQQVYQQQWDMYCNKTQRCAHRIVSISQPYVRPIVRGKQDKPVEFGAKLSVSLTGEGFARVDALRWEAFHEGQDLMAQVEAYRARYGYYPERVLADSIYGTRPNRAYLKARGIRFAGKPLGRPKRVTEENQEQLRQAKAQRRQDYRQRIPIEGKFGQGKSAYQLNYIRAKRANTAFAWINSIFLVMNLLILQRIFFGLWKLGYIAAMNTLQHFWQRMLTVPSTYFGCSNSLASSQL